MAKEGAARGRISEIIEDVSGYFFAGSFSVNCKVEPRNGVYGHGLVVGRTKSG